MREGSEMLKSKTYIRPNGGFMFLRILGHRVSDIMLGKYDSRCFELVFSDF